MNQALNLMAPGTRANPYPLYAELRRTPIRPIEPNGMWAISRFDDVVEVLKDARRFSSEGLARSFRPPWLERNPTAESLVMKDPPAHGRLRGRVSRAFSPAAVARLETKVRAIADELAGRAVRRGELDLVADFAVQLSVRVLGVLFGLEPEWQQHLKTWADDLLSIPASHPSPERMIAIRRSLAEMEQCFGQLIDARRESPGECLVSELLQPDEQGGSLTRDEVMAFLFALLPAGMETTTHLISNTLVVLSTHREEASRVMKDQRLVPALVEEVLRYEPSGHASLRLSTEETTISGVTVPQGAVVAVLLASALRDERQYPEADRFILGRPKHSNLAFGHGIHFCLGAMLARLEARLGLEALFSRIRDFSVQEQELQWSPSLIARGPLSLRVRLEPAAGAGA